MDARDPARAVAIGPYRDALALVDDVRPHATGGGPARLLGLRADLLTALGDPGTASAYREALDGAAPDETRRIRVRFARAAVLAGDAETAASALPYPEVIAVARDLQATARRSGAQRAEAFAAALVGEAARPSGDLPLAAAELTRAAQRELGSSGGEAHALQRLAEVHLAVASARPPGGWRARRCRSRASRRWPPACCTASSAR